MKKLIILAGLFLLASIPSAAQDRLAEIKALAEKGDADAQYTLGLVYRTGAGLPRDYQAAAKWYRKAAEQGDTRAQIGLGVMYERGEGVPQDYKESYKWYNIVAAGGDLDAANNRDFVAGKLSRREIAEAERLSREWVKKPAQATD